MVRESPVMRIRHVPSALFKLSHSALTPISQTLIFLLFTSFPLRNVFRKRPRIVFKYLHQYLFLSMGRTARLAAFLFHYRFILAYATTGFYSELIARKHIVWKTSLAAGELKIRLTFPFPDDQEGDLSLVASVDSQQLYILSFSIIQGALIGLPHPQVIFIARIQGLSDIETIRHVTSQCEDITPPALLMSALEGLTQAFCIPVIVGVSASEQLSSAKLTNGRSLVFDYDFYWESMGGEKSTDHFIFQVPFIHKPIEEIRSNHRRRTIKKRAYRKSVSELVESYSCANFLKKND